MKTNLQGRNFLKLLDFTPEEIVYMLDVAADLKEKKEGNSGRFLPWKECCPDF